VIAINKEQYRRSRHAVHAVKYHFVWIPKRRKRVLKGAVANRLRQILEEVADENDWEIIALSIEPDHVHLFVQADTRHAPYQVIHAFKGRSSHVLRKEYKHLLRLPSLWTRSYFVSTTGKVSEPGDLMRSPVVEQYIEDQS
jgi:putative transposase